MTQQDKFPVQVKAPTAKKELLFERLDATERVSEPFCLDLTVVCAADDVNADQLLGQSVTIAVQLPSGAKRAFNGLVTRFVRTGEQIAGTTQSQLQLFRYQLRLQPWLWFLTRTSDCRIFQNQSVSDIFSQVAKGHGFTDFRLSLTGTYEKFEYCVQYRETDFNFVSRLLEAAGIFYFFEHQDGKHVMVLADDVGAFRAASGYQEVKFNQARSGRTTADTLEAWSVEQTVQPGEYATTDFNFETPSRSLLSTANQPRIHSRSKFAVFDYPAGAPVLNSNAVGQVATVRLQEAQARFERYRGTSGDCYGLQTGAKFSLTGHPQTAFNKPNYAIIATEHTIVSNTYSTGGAGHSMTVVVEAIDASTRFRPARVTPKPVIQGAQTAMVVGPSGNEIYTDKYGRVKVQFPWDRYGVQDENSSCWMRVAQVWAGKNWGSMHIPRVGQEVLVSFLEGDPDRPIITGRVYNAESMPPYGLPGKMTQSGITSRSTKGGQADNFNEIRFDDAKGSELFNIQAEKDFTSLVKHDETTEVRHDRTDTVGNDENLTIKHDQSTTISGKETRTVSGDRTSAINGNENLTVGKDQKIDVGQTFELTAAQKITLTTGQSKLVMQQDGTIELSGVNVTVKGLAGVTVQVSSSSVKLDPANVKIAATLVGVSANAQAQVQGSIVQVSGSGMTQISGGVIMIG